MVLEWALNIPQLTLIDQQFLPTMIMWEIAQLGNTQKSPKPKKNPPKPKSVFIWDVYKVLSYFNNLPMNEEL